MYTGNIIFPWISWEGSSLAFHPKKKYYVFGKKNTIFPDNTTKIMSQRGTFWKDHFSERLKKISYFRVFFWERSSFIFRLRGKIIFSGKRNIIFPDNTKKIIFQLDFFGKIIFSGRQAKENMVFHGVKVPSKKWKICRASLKFQNSKVVSTN